MEPEEQKIQKNHKEMSEDQKYECCKNHRDVNQEKMFIAERRTSELADEFTRLEVQIAIILFGLIGIFAGFLNNQNEDLFLLKSREIKIAYLSIFLLLIASLTSGLIHIKRREYFWEGHLLVRISRGNKWNDAIKKKTTYEEAMSFHQGTANNRMDILSKSPDWTWILQTIFLASAVVIIFVLFVMYLFQ